jgi:hypothetical protein
MTAMIQTGMPESDRLAVLELFEEKSQIIQEMKNWSIGKILQKVIQLVLSIILVQAIFTLKIREEDFINKNLLSVLPEEWQADLQALKKRWLKNKFSSFKIRRLTIKYLCDMYFAVVRIKI